MHPEVKRLLYETDTLGRVIWACADKEPPLPGRSLEDYVPTKKALSSLNMFIRDVIHYLYKRYDPPAFASQLAMVDIVLASDALIRNNERPTLLDYYVQHVKGNSVFKRLSALYPNMPLTRKAVHRVLTSKVPQTYQQTQANRYSRAYGARAHKSNRYPRTVAMYMDYLVRYPLMRPELRELLIKTKQDPDSYYSRDITHKLITFLLERQYSEWKYCPKNKNQIRDIIDYFEMTGRAFGDAAVEAAYGRSLHTLWKHKEHVARADARKNAMQDAEPWSPSGLKSTSFVENETTIQFIELLTPVDLYEEGEAMCHCVAGYYGRCQSGETAIFSARSGSGKRLMTIEVNLKRKAIVQARGKHNRDTTVIENKGILWFANLNRLIVNI